MQKIRLKYTIKCRFCFLLLLAITQTSGVYYDNTHIAFRAERIALLIPCYFSIDDIHIAIFIY